MFANVPILAFVSLVLINGVQSQFTTASIFPGDNGAIDDLKGEIVGTGSDGTTYVVSGSVSGLLVTETIVEAATYLSENIAIETSSVTLRINQACGLDNPSASETSSDGELVKIADCTAVVALNGPGIAAATTTDGTALVTLAPVVLATQASHALRSLRSASVGAGLVIVVASASLLL